MRQYQGHGRHAQGKKTGVDRWRRPCAAHLTPLAHRWRPTLLSTLPQGSDRRASRLGVMEISAPRCHVSARATWAFYTSTESDPGRGTRLAPSRPPRAATGRGRARDFFSEYARNPFRTRRSPSGRLPYGHATPRSRRWLLRCRRAVPSRPARTGWTLLVRDPLANSCHRRGTPLSAWTRRLRQLITAFISRWALRPAWAPDRTEQLTRAPGVKSATHRADCG